MLRDAAAGFGRPATQGTRETLGFLPGITIGLALLLGGVAFVTVATPRLRSSPVGSWRWHRELMWVASGVGAVLIGATLSVVLILREIGIVEAP